MDHSSTVSVGIIANPASGRDIRRLTAKASVFSTAEKANMVQRLLGPFGALGVEQVLMMPDTRGIASAVRRAVETNPARELPAWPRVEFIEQDLLGGPEDSQVAAHLMEQAGARIIVVLGGDGTHRVVAAAVPAIPLATLSTGTNNVFPDWREATVTGIATALYASGRVARQVALRRNKRLRVELGDRIEIALVDACVTRLTHVGARAIWEPETITELFVAFAEPDAIGLSSIAAMIEPVSRDAPYGAHLSCTPDGRRVLAPIAPGVLESIAVDHFGRMEPGVPHLVHAERGSIALDGEREIEFHRGQVPKVSLELDGPETLNVTETLAAAVALGVLADSRVELELQ
ncbi:MAG: ATP-NAD kinase [Gammaproteobacteria bacterium]|nr:ATP-NAD kinase [Gammaproteobacteria bacterium]